jgi:hypothetical protein
MIVLNITICQNADGETELTLPSKFGGDTPGERDALVQLTRETNRPGNVVHRALVRMCEERGIAWAE